MSEKQMQKLVMADDLMPSVLDGTKRITIRNGHRDIVEGDCEIVNVSQTQRKVVRVNSVLKTLAGEISLKDLKSDGFRNRKHFIEGMRRFYPDFAPENPATVIKW